MRSAWIVSVLVAAASACRPGSPGTDPAAPAVPVVPPVPTVPVVPAAHAVAEARARQILEQQLSAASSENVNADEDARDTALRATFAAGAVLSEEGGARPASELHASVLDRIAIDELTADGDSEGVYFTATFHDIAPPNWRNPASTDSWFPVRYVGVAARSAGWKVIAASMVFTGYGVARGSGHVGMNPFPNATTTSVLSPLALDGPSLARAVSARTMVIGLDGKTAGTGPQALGVWATRKLILDPDDREIVAPTWTTLQANVVFSDPKEHGNLGLFVVARLVGRNSWQPVLVQYLGR